MTPVRALLLCLDRARCAPAVAAAQAPERPLVYVFVLDGLDGDAVDAGKAPFLSELIAGQGGRTTYYEESRSVIVAETNPNHTAMASGQYAGASGIPGNAFAVYGEIPDEDSCPAPGQEGNGPLSPTSGESATCLQAQTFFQAADRQTRPEEITTAGVFGKPKLARIFSTRRVDGQSYDADYLWTPCESPSDDTPYCKQVPIQPATRYAATDGVVMDELIRTVDEGVPADGATKRPDLTFVNFPQIDSAGHATGTGSAYDQAIGLADQEIRRFVEHQREAGLWERTVMVLLSDHSMDTTPTKTALASRFSAAGIPSDSYEIVLNGSVEMIYLTDRASPGRFDLLKRMRAATMSGGLPGAAPVIDEALYREPNPLDGGDAFTIDGAHPEWHASGPRTGDLFVTHMPGGAFSDPLNPLPGNHGSPHTADNFFAVTGGGTLVRQQALAGQAAPRFEDRALNPGQAENVDVAPTVMRLLGRQAPANSSGRFLDEAFEASLVPQPAGRRTRLRLSVTPRRVRQGRRVRFRFVARTGGGARVQGARIRFAGRRVRTNSRGRATMRVRFRRGGPRVARARRPGYRAGRVTVRVTRRPRAARFAG